MFAVKKVNRGPIIDKQQWRRTWPPNGSSRIRAKQKLLKKHKGACKSFWSRIGSLKSVSLTIPWNLAKPVKIFPGIVARRHHTDQKQIGLLKEQCVEWKKVLLHYCRNQVWMNIGGQILWNTIPMKHSRSLVWWEMSIRETFWKTIYWTDHSVWFIGWVLPYFCERPVKNPSIWKESITWIVPWIRFVRGVNLEGWRTGRRPWGVGNDGRIRKKTLKDSNISHQKWKIHISSRRWTNRILWKRSGTDNIHLDTASSNSMRGSHWLSWRTRRDSSTFSRLISGCRWSDKWFLVRVGKLRISPSRWTQSQTLLARMGKKCQAEEETKVV